MRSVERNPAAWFLFFLLLVSSYGNYQGHHGLTKVCEDFGDMMNDRPFVALRSTWADWQKGDAAEIEDICGGELGEAEPRDE